jgi:hypothetical protein
MKFAIQVRHPTGGISPADYWFGFVAKVDVNTSEGPLPRFSSIEVAELNLGLQDERRINGQFSYPIALHRAQQFRAPGEYDKSIVSRLYVEVANAEAAFAQGGFLRAVELVFARRDGTLAALAEPVEFRLFVDEERTARASILLEQHLFGQQAVRCDLLKAARGEPLAYCAPTTWKPIPEFGGGVSAYLRRREEQAVRAEREKRAGLGRAPAAPKAAPPRQIADPPAVAATQPPRETAPPREPVAPPFVQPVRPAPPPPAPLPRFGLRWAALVALASTLLIAFLGTLGWNTPAEVPVAATVAPSLAGGVQESAPPAAAQGGRSEATPQSAPPTEPSLPDASPDPVAVAGEIKVPVGNAPSAREDLYKFGFPDQLAALKAVLNATGALDGAEFDAQSGVLRSLRPAREWPKDQAKERREFNERMEYVINYAKRSENKEALTKAVDLSEQFLATHFGHSTAHLNLSIAQAALGNSRSSLPAAFHAIVFNPEGANGWVALGIGLALSGDDVGATRAFCAALRKTKFSDRTVSYFERVARGEEMGYPPVTQAMNSTLNACPRDRWAG